MAALPSSTQRPLTNGSSAPSNISSNSWRRDGDSSSTNNNGNTNRGGGRGRGRARGGRRGGGASPREARPPVEVNSSQPEVVSSSKPKAVVPPSNAPSVPAVVTEKRTPSTTSNPKSVPSASSSTNPTTPAASRPKPPSRRASRNVPTLAVISPPTPSKEESTTPVSARSQNKRRRSTLKTPISATSTKSLPSPLQEKSLKPPLKSQTASSVSSSPIKSPSPLLAPSDMRSNIDALVERVRAVAMADNRPTTPGSHIDWAGDDDDSLPDLDDWGVTTTPHVQEASPTQYMSPIILDGLKPLPEPVHSTLSIVENIDIQPVILQTTPLIKDDIKPADLDPHFLEASPATTNSKPESGRNGHTVRHTNNHTVQTPRKPLLHPSLPSKPVDVALAKPKQSPTNPRPTPNTSLPTVDPRSMKKAPEPLVLPSSPSNEASHETEAPKQGLYDSIHAPLQTLVVRPEPLEGLAASMHAPQMSDSFSAPSNLTTYSATPNGPRNPALTHTRAHTVGRPNYPRGDRNPRSGSATPNGGPSSGGGYHARTHSTPPTGNHQRLHHSRPVITGGAISQVMRVIAGTPLRSTTVTPD